MRRCGQARRRAPARRAQASSRCSQLSSTSSRVRGRQRGRERGEPRPPGLLPDPEGRGGRLGHQGRVGQRRQLHQPHPLGVGRPRAGGGLERQAGLAHPAGAGQGQQAHLLLQEALPHGGDLPLSPDEAGELQGQVVRARVARVPGRPGRRRGRHIRGGAPGPARGAGSARGGGPRLERRGPRRAQPQGPGQAAHRLPLGRPPRPPLQVADPPRGEPRPLRQPLLRQPRGPAPPPQDGPERLGRRAAGPRRNHAPTPAHPPSLPREPPDQRDGAAGARGLGAPKAACSLQHTALSGCARPRGCVGGCVGCPRGLLVAPGRRGAQTARHGGTGRGAGRPLRQEAEPLRTRHSGMRGRHRILPVCAAPASRGSRVQVSA